MVFKIFRYLTEIMDENFVQETVGLLKKVKSNTFPAPSEVSPSVSGAMFALRRFEVEMAPGSNFAPIAYNS